MKRYNLIRKIFILIIIFALASTFLFNSSNSQKLDNIAYIVSIGIDKGDIEKYKISFQVSTIQSTASSIENEQQSKSKESSGSNDTSYTVNTVECPSIDSGISLINTHVNKDVSLSHCKMILVSEEIAREGIADIIYTIVNKVDIRPDCNIIVSQTSNSDLTDAKDFALQDVLTKYYDIISGNSQEEISEYTKIVKLIDFYSYLKDPIYEPIASLGTVSNPTSNSNKINKNAVGVDRTVGKITSENEEPLVNLLGLAVFKDDKFIGTLSGIETICYLILNKELLETTISIPSPFEQDKIIDLYLTFNEDPKIKIYIDNNSSPYINVEANIVTRLLSFNNSQSTVTQEEIKKIEASAKQYLTDQLLKYLYRTSKDFKSDISGIGLYAAKNFSTQQEWDNYNWPNIYEASSFNVNVNLTLKSGYLLTNK